MLAEIIHIQAPGGARWVIGSIALFHTAVASLSIGFAFIVTCMQLAAWRRKDNRYDLMAKKVQLWHVCMYNIGTINAIGLVFALSGLYPQFWSQIFVEFFWSIMIEEFLFFLLATTITFHYFFWDKLWGHKRLQILTGALLTPLFFLQFFIINGMGGFMVTPGATESSLSLWGGTVNILGWSFKPFYNPTFLMLTLHRTLANFSYGGFIVAGALGVKMYFTQRPKVRDAYRSASEMAFGLGLVALLGLPVVGYFYAHALHLDPEGNIAYVNLMWGKGDIVAGGIDWWWLKHVIVAAMVGMGLAYAWQANKRNGKSTLASVLIACIAVFYLMFYIAMGAVMTWFFFWMMLLAAVAAALLARHLAGRHADGSGQAVWVLLAILSFATVMLGGYSREAARARFVDATGKEAPIVGGIDPNRYAHYDDIYVKPERQKSPGPMTMVLEMPDYVKAMAPRQTEPAPTPGDMPALITRACSICHTLERMHNFRGKDWGLVVHRMRAYGAPVTVEEAAEMAEHLKAGKPY